MIINDLYNNKKFVAEGEITKAAIEYKIKNDDGKFSQRHVEFAKSDLDKQLVRLKNNPNIKDVKIVQGVAHTYLEFGSYFNTWRKRNALKMWTGWPTFPMVFVKGSLVGGAEDLAALIQSGALKKLLA